MVMTFGFMIKHRQQREGGQIMADRGSSLRVRARPVMSTPRIFHLHLQVLQVGGHDTDAPAWLHPVDLMQLRMHPLHLLRMRLCGGCIPYLGLALPLHVHLHLGLGLHLHLLHLLLCLVLLLAVGCSVIGHCYCLVVVAALCWRMRVRMAVIWSYPTVVVAANAVAIPFAIALISGGVFAPSLPSSLGQFQRRSSRSTCHRLHAHSYGQCGRIHPVLF